MTTSAYPRMDVARVRYLEKYPRIPGICTTTISAYPGMGMARVLHYTEIPARLGCNFTTGQ